ncbi:MAG: molecular chaperone DnaK, partial [Streptomycetaceae bacterium]|nr:molecular chaperone DnaK [Streptomycetaceae bacterium]
GEVKTEVETAVGELKEKLKGEDITAIREATEKVAAVSQKLGQAMYAQASADGAGAAAGAEGAGLHDVKDAAGEDVVDAEIVDDEGVKREGGAA